MCRSPSVARTSPETMSVFDERRRLRRRRRWCADTANIKTRSSSWSSPVRRTHTHTQFGRKYGLEGMKNSHTRTLLDCIRRPDRRFCPLVLGPDDKSTLNVLLLVVFRHRRRPLLITVIQRFCPPRGPPVKRAPFPQR